MARGTWAYEQPGIPPGLQQDPPLWERFLQGVKEHAVWVAEYQGIMLEGEPQVSELWLVTGTWEIDGDEVRMITPDEIVPASDTRADQVVLHLRWESTEIPEGV